MVASGHCLDTLPFGFGGFGTNSMLAMGGADYWGGSRALEQGRVGDVSAPLVGTGLHATSVAQVYYHRPGWWWEHPNLFNPFWRAKLAPIQDKLKRLPDGAIFSRLTQDLSGVLRSSSGSAGPDTLVMH